MARNPSGLLNLGNLLRPLKLVPASNERVVPTEWQVRTVLGDCTTRARVSPVQAPQYREVKYAINKCESLGTGRQLILHGNPSAIARDFPRMWQSFDVICFRVCTSSAVCCFRAPSVAILTSLRPLPGCSCENPFKTNWREGLSCSPSRCKFQLGEHGLEVQE